MTAAVIVFGEKQDVTVDAESWRWLDLAMSLVNRDGLPHPSETPLSVSGSEAARIADDLHTVLRVGIEHRVESGLYDWPPGASVIASLWHVFVHGTDGVFVARLPGVD